MGVLALCRRSRELIITASSGIALRGATLLLLSILSTAPAAPAAAADDAPPACRLTPAGCASVLREVAVDAELFAQNQDIVGFGVSPQVRASALIQRDEDRMAVRFHQLPASVAAEIARIQACHALGDAASADPPCR
ncbi:hypothetical protein D3273_27940 [Lichenibacterium minor]|uniref:Uncharacterized protein n=1 Tax=Lichenibacterium minor TaxID=2316528 RepID=A0A4Q2TYA7_9HYPH|nr:hypothetical protein [Lichenibacterium minor]RYC28700.1 hypothetical protein D3273_27940 [Lichenibacterium minor]